MEGLRLVNEYVHLDGLGIIGERSCAVGRAIVDSRAWYSAQALIRRRRGAARYLRMRLKRRTSLV